MQLFRMHPAQALVMAVLELWLLTLYAAAARALWRPAIARPVLLCLLVCVLWFLAASGGVQAVGRYRLPIMPVVCVLAAAGLLRQSGKEAPSMAEPAAQ
jgi:hypothetical protein